MKQIQPPRGTQDIIPPLSERFRAHERRGEALFERAGYQPIITPMFEDTALFVRGVGEGSDIVSKEMYTFADRSENSLTLRPEGTAPALRAVLSANLHEQGLPVKVWYSAAMFRYDRPQKGRYRQHHQLGIEAVGTEDPLIDAEVITIGKQLLESAGLDDSVLLLNSIGHPGCRGPYLEILKEWLRARRDELDDDCRRRIETNPLRVFDCKVPKDREILSTAPTITDNLCAECAEHFLAVRGFLADAGVSFIVDPRLVRGIDYYTRTAFEFQTPHLESQQNTVCGGGRYDGLSELIGGPRLPGIGFGSGIERVLLAAEIAEAGKPRERRWQEQETISAFVIAVGETERLELWRIVRQLRDVGLTVDFSTSDRGLKAALKHANRIGALFAVIIGPEERENGQVTIRDMASGEQTVQGQLYLGEWFDRALHEKGILVTRADGREPY
jgi:histidyl-tRNA synthetase